MESVSFSAKLVAFLSGFSGLAAYSVILGVLFACGLGIPIPEDITLLAAGILAALDKISLWGAILAGLVGVMVGDTFLFYLGRRLGRRVFELPGFRRVFTKERAELAERKILENSRFICFTARFIPGLRSPIFLTAGIMGVRPVIFFGLDGLAALLSVPFWVVVGYWFGKNIDQALEIAKELQLYMIAGVVLLILAYVLYRKRKKVGSQSPQV